MYLSETSQFRDRILPWLDVRRQNGVDLGSGGDPLSPHTISMDLPEPYAHTHDAEGRSGPQHLRGDAKHLYWFRDRVLDYVYSSHLLEDYAETEQILAEWLRVLKAGGRLVLLLPDEMKYRAHCTATGQGYNGNHKQTNMAREWLCGVLNSLGCSIVHSEDCPPYSFLVVAERP